MKNIIFYALVALFSLAAETLIAQAPPQKMTYQFVARNGQNQLIQNNAVGLRISILQGSTSGTAVYVETHTPQTNGNGLATMEVGAGTVVSGIFANIDWSTGVYFIQTEMDPQGQQGYSITAVSQLLSVPYAFYAGRATYADSVSGGMNETDPTFNASVAAGITPADTARWNQDLVDDADSDPTNELQTLSVVGDSVFLSGSGGSFSVSDGDTSLWKVDNFGIHYDQGNVGIGINSDPLVTLNIVKDIPSGGARKFINVHNTTNSIQSSADISVSAGTGGDRTFLSHWGPTYANAYNVGGFGGMSSTGKGLAFLVHDTSSFKFITGSNSTPTEIFRINSNGVGIGTANPLFDLEVSSNSLTNTRGALFSHFQSNTAGINLTLCKFRGTQALPLNVQNGDYLGGIFFSGYTGTQPSQTNLMGSALIGGRINGTVTSASVPVDLFFATGATTNQSDPYPQNTVRMVVASDGNVGVGTTNPNSKLQVTNGDVYIENISTGVILRSPNGGCWRVTVDNTGNLVRTAITCP